MISPLALLATLALAGPGDPPPVDIRAPEPPPRREPELVVYVCLVPEEFEDYVLLEPEGWRARPPGSVLLKPRTDFFEFLLGQADDF